MVQSYSVEQCPISGDPCRGSNECTPLDLKCLVFTKTIVNVAKADMLGQLDPLNANHAQWIALGPSMVDRVSSMSAGIARSLGLDPALFLAEVIDELKGEAGATHGIQGLMK